MSYWCFAVAKEALWKKVPEKVLHRPPQKGAPRLLTRLS